MTNNRRRNHSYENYVCPNCFRKLPECTCEDAMPPYKLIWIDLAIQDHVRILNEKGYYTKFCCEGHDENDYMDVMFKTRCEPPIDNLPDGFKYNKKWNRIESDKYKDLDGGYESKEKYLDSLLAWCNELPEKETKKNNSWL